MTFYVCDRHQQDSLSNTLPSESHLEILTFRRFATRLEGILPTSEQSSALHS